MKILIVDDKEENLYFLEALLKGSGYQVVSAGNGAEALEKLRSEGAEMIISDVLMPVMDGFKLCIEVRADEAFKDIPLVFYTATYKDKRDEELALKMGADRYIIKPMEPDELLEILQAVIRDAEKGNRVSKTPVTDEGEEIFKLYSERLVNKLENKMLKLEETEKNLRIINRSLETLLKCNQVLIRATDETNILDEICRAIVEIGGYRFAWVGFADQDQEKTLRPVAQAGYEAGYLSTLNLTWADTERGRCPAATSIRTEKTIAIRDILKNPDCLPWRDEAIKHGYASSIAIPLIAYEQVLGTLNIFAAKPEAFDTEEVELLSNLAGDMAFGIMALRTREERKQADEALRRERDLLGRIMATSPAGIVMLDARGRIDFANARAEEVLGLGKSALIGRAYNDPEWKITGLQGNPLPDEQLPFRQVMASGQPLFDFHCAILWPDGRRVLLSINSTPLFDDAGEVPGVISTVEDITKKVELENQLIHAQKMESVGMLAGGVAHDFNNLLTSIMGYSSLIKRDTSLTEKQRDRVSEMEKAAQRGAEITRQLLTFSRKQPLRLEVTDLNGIVNQTLRFIRRGCSPDIIFKTELHNDLNKVNADGTQIQQVLMNLCLNARDAMPQGGDLFIKTENVVIDNEYVAQYMYAKTGPHVLISVTDTGMGMDAQTQSRIFEPFFTTKETGKGTGLGLAIVYGIVKTHGGFINVYSELGQGTTFKLYLPRAADQEELVKAAESPVKGGKETVLIVDDEEMILNLAASILEDYGYKCITKDQSLEALKIYQQKYKEIDLVVMDIVMPKMNGVELFEKIKKINPQVKAIMSSGFSVQDQDSFYRMGIKAFVPKPYQERTLAGTIREVLDHKA